MNMTLRCCGMTNVSMRRRYGVHEVESASGHWGINGKIVTMVAYIGDLYNGVSTYIYLRSKHNHIYYPSRLGRVYGDRPKKHSVVEECIQ